MVTCFLSFIPSEFPGLQTRFFTSLHTEKLSFFNLTKYSNIFVCIYEVPIIIFNVLSCGRGSNELEGQDMDRERDRGTGGKEFEKIYRTDSCFFPSPLYKCFSKWNLRHHRNQRWYKQGIKTLIIIDLMLNVGTYLIVSILTQCSSLCFQKW